MKPSRYGLQNEDKTRIDAGYERTEKVEERVCGECALGEWNMENRNFKGEPFIGYCEHVKFGHSKDDRGVFLDNTPACTFFEAGKKKGSAK